MRERIEDALKQHTADFVEIRIEETKSTGITYRGKDLEEVGTTTQLGGNVRAAVNGGWGFVSFNRIVDLREKVSQAVSQARLVGNEKTELVEVPPVQDVVQVSMQRDPWEVSLAEKKQLMDSYVEEIWRTPKIQTSTVHYGDGYRKQYYGNSTGTYIEQERGRVFARFGVVARDNGNVQQSRAGFASSEDYGVVEGRHADVREAAEKAVDMLDAQPPKGGEFMVILDSTLAGVFAHEAFGHLSEADHVYENDKLREIMVLGRTFGGKFLNITDSGEVRGLTGSFAYDDEGVPTGKQYLIRDGELVGRLHSRETAGKMNEAPTGNARAQSYSVPPLVRMRNTAIEPGETPLEDMLAEVKDGVYCKNWYGGQTSMEMFTFSCMEAYAIRDGKLAEPLRGVNLSGNVFTTLENIVAVGNDFAWDPAGGTCGKGGQSAPVGDGSPHVLISKCLVGGQ
ncbi:MAG: TldD/PmbA family protein [Chloroflexota bacterium]|nr:TldD/PmbA family protein [Chloroflexota bacterium]MDE2840868.1 TldD/PmbA family protein [Chloroflexota bacterium]MDE2931423.1 TldD/PmbA family protein [Chloroflexota bacterium]